MLAPRRYLSSPHLPGVICPYPHTHPRAPHSAHSPFCVLCVLPLLPPFTRSVPPTPSFLSSPHLPSSFFPQYSHSLSRTAPTPACPLVGASPPAPAFLISRLSFPTPAASPAPTPGLSSGYSETLLRCPRVLHHLTSPALSFRTRTHTGASISFSAFSAFPCLVPHPHPRLISHLSFLIPQLQTNRIPAPRYSRRTHAESVSSPLPLRWVEFPRLAIRSTTPPPISLSRGPVFATAFGG
ncbi:hypothetical protein B0H11DRAFT_2108882 [Mycena galericulata]|nr:hypothetical protein B0H11DRAFT_2108882 [Mycena galericulata]